MEMDLTSVARALGCCVPERLAGVAVTAAVSDSREAGPGTLFACVRGERVDGHDYALKACEAGAVAVLAERVPEGLAGRFPDVPVFVVPDTVQGLGRLARAWRDAFRGTVVGITGTAGKTTTKEWLAAALETFGETARTEGNHNNQLGLPLSMLAATGRERFWVFECGVSHPGDMEELGAILAPDVAVVLNTGAGHTEGLGDRGVAWHKTRIFTLMRPGGRAVAGADYADLVRETLAAAPDASFFSGGRPCAGLPAGQPCCTGEAAADGRVDVRLGLGGRPETLRLAAPMRGPAAAENLACVCLVCALLGLDPEAAAKGIARARVPGHRWHPVETPRGLVIDDCYNANPLSMSRMLAAAADEAASRRTPLALVLGEMGELGDLSASCHRRLGEELRRAAPCLVFWKGGHAEDVRAGLGPDIPFHPFASAEAFAAMLPGLLPGGRVTVLCKGSRSNGLEDCVDALINLFRPEGD